MQNYVIHLATWNVGDAAPGSDRLQTLLGVDNSKVLPDLIGIGLQEVSYDKKWSALLQDILQPLDYVLIKVRNLWAIWLYVYVARKHLPAITNVESEVTASGLGGVMGNKGGVSIRFDWHGVNLIIVCAHFTAHMENQKDRINDYVDIITSQKFRDPDVESVLDHDYIFWLGDLNFRIDQLTKVDVEKKIKEKKFDELVKHDQLKQAMSQNLLLTGFREGPLNFAPTYRFDAGTNIYDSSKKQRVPAWTDRILHLVNHDSPHKLNIQLDQYGSLKDNHQSDHQPVLAKHSVAFPITRQAYLPVTFVTPLGSLCQSEKSSEKSHVTHTKDVGEFSYYVNPKVHDSTFELDTWDWIAILPANYHSAMKDYYAYIYVPTADMKEASSGPVKAFIEKRYLEQLHGQRICLAYFSKKKNCIQGISKPFVI